MTTKAKDLARILMSDSEMAGRKIESIRIVRAATGVTLKEAKNAVVEAYENRDKDLAAQNVDQALQLARVLVRSYSLQDKKIEVIKILRGMFGIGLVEAKKAVDQARAELARANTIDEAISLLEQVRWDSIGVNNDIFRAECGEAIVRLRAMRDGV